MNKFESLKARLIYRWAVIKAKKEHEKTGCRYFVIPVRHPSKYLMVVRREDLGKLHKKHWIDFSRIEDAIKGSFYFTAAKNGKGEIPDKLLPTRQAIYQFWFEQRLIDMPQERREYRRRRRQEILAHFKR